MAKGIGASLGSGLAGITKSLDEMGAELDAEEAEVRQCVCLHVKTRLFLNTVTFKNTHSILYQISV